MQTAGGLAAHRRVRVGEHARDRLDRAPRIEEHQREDGGAAHLEVRVRELVPKQRKHGFRPNRAHLVHDGI